MVHQIHKHAIVNSVQKVVSKEIKDKPWHVEGTDNAEWVLMDYVSIVHVFQKKKFVNIIIASVPKHKITT